MWQQTISLRAPQQFARDINTYVTSVEINNDTTEQGFMKEIEYRDDGIRAAAAVIITLLTNVSFINVYKHEKEFNVA